VNTDDLRRALARLASDDDEEGIERIVRAATEESRSAADAAVAVWLEGGELGTRARSILVSLDDLALASLARSRIPAESSDRAFRMQAIARGARAAQTRAVNALFASLDDRTDLGSPGGVAESRAPARRVCDEAYLLLRGLLFADGAVAGSVASSEAFLANPERERDALIREAKTSGVFRRLVDDADVEL
jgi:hypothetical protein